MSRRAGGLGVRTAAPGARRDEEARAPDKAGHARLTLLLACGATMFFATYGPHGIVEQESTPHRNA